MPAATAETGGPGLESREADVERRRLSGAYVEIRGVAAVSIAPHFDPMRARSNLHDQLLVVGRSFPHLAVNQDLGACRLPPDRDRSRICLSYRRIVWRLSLEAARWGR